MNEVNSQRITGDSSGRNCDQWKNFIAPPKAFNRGKNINDHVEKVEEYLSISNCSESFHTKILLASLEENCQFELFSYNDFEQNKDDYSWVKSKLIEVFAKKQSKVSPIRELFKLKQGERQCLKNYVSDVRASAFRLLSNLVEPNIRER